MNKKPLGAIDVARVFTPATYAKRIRERLSKSASALNRRPDRSLPHALGTAGYQAFGRLLRNPRVLEQLPIEPIYAQTLSRVVEGEELVAIHDTTDFAFGGKEQRKTLPRINGEQRGFRGHFTLLARADGSRMPLGVSYFESIVRPDVKGPPQSTQERYDDPNKESLRWSRGIRHTEALVAGRAGVIHLMDREADDYAMLATMVESGSRFVQRQRQARRIVPSEEGSREQLRIDQAFAARTEGVFEREVPLSARANNKSSSRPPEARKLHPPRNARIARLSFDAMAVQIRRSSRAPHSMASSVGVNVVHVREIDPPADEPAVEWYLLTSEPIDSVGRILRIVDLYRLRWTIEEFFKAIKTGCAMEKRQLESVDALLITLIIFMPIATNMLGLRAAARSDPQAPASVILEPHELAVLRACDPRRISDAPTASEALLAVARLGGHLSQNGPPGWLVLARGMWALHERVEGWRLAVIAAEQSITKRDQS